MLKHPLVRIVLLVASTPACAKDLTPQAKERAAALKADLDNFSLTIRCHGERSKPAYYSVMLTVAALRDGAPYLLRARVAPQQAERIVDHLAAEGFLDAANDQRTQDVVPPKGPLYTLTVSEWGRVPPSSPPTAPPRSATRRPPSPPAAASWSP